MAIPRKANKEKRNKKTTLSKKNFNLLFLTTSLSILVKYQPCPKVVIYVPISNIGAFRPTFPARLPSMIPISIAENHTSGQSTFGNSVGSPTNDSEIDDDDFVTCST